MTQNWDVIIVGGGLAGYVAANFLARENVSVLLLEKGGHVGGRARTNKLKQQYFNIGPHALYKKGKSKEILEQLGISLRGHSPKLECVLIENHLEYAAPFSPTGFFSSLLSWKERMEWASVLLKINNLNPHKITEQTFDHWVTQTAKSNKVQTLLYLLGRLATYCHAPERMCAKVMLTHLKTVSSGVLYIDGGWQTMIDQLHNNAVVSGVQVRTRSAVKKIEFDKSNHLKLVLSDDEEIFGKYAVCTTGPHELADMLSDQVSFPQKDFLTEITSVRGATLDVALTKLPNPKQLFAMDLTNPYYFSVHSSYAKLSEDGKSAVLHVFKYHHPDEDIDENNVKHELEQFLEKMQPGWQNHVITSRFIPQLIVNQRLPQPGDEHKLQHSKMGIPGLYIAGDWASPHSILAEGAIASGKEAAEEIIKKIKG